MDWKQNRLYIMAGVAALMIGVTWWAVTSQTGDTEVEEGTDPTLPEIEREEITALEIHLPASEDDEAVTIRLVKDGEDWRLAAPVEAAASSTAISTALDKLTDLEVVGRAASQAAHHERLEVDEAHGIRVIATTGDDTAVDMWVGAYQTGNTMVRLEGSDEVLMVRGSIKFAFNKRPRDWRDRAILELTAAEVHEVEFTNSNGHWLFRKGGEAAAGGEGDEGEGGEGEGDEGEGDEGEGDEGEGDEGEGDADAWREILLEPAEGEEPPTPIENFEAAKVRTMVSSLARLRASDFGGADDTPASVGCDGSARVRMVSGEGDAEQTINLVVGNEQGEGNRYVMLEGDETIYVVSRFMAERLFPTVESFQPGTRAKPRLLAVRPVACRECPGCPAWAARTAGCPEAPPAAAVRSRRRSCARSSSSCSSRARAAEAPTEPRPRDVHWARWTETFSAPVCMSRST